MFVLHCQIFAIGYKLTEKTWRKVSKTHFNPLCWVFLCGFKWFKPGEFNQPRLGFTHLTLMNREMNLFYVACENPDKKNWHLLLLSFWAVVDVGRLLLKKSHNHKQASFPCSYPFFEPNLWNMLSHNILF